MEFSWTLSFIGPIEEVGEKKIKKRDIVVSNMVETEYWEKEYWVVAALRAGKTEEIEKQSMIVWDSVSVKLSPKVFKSEKWGKVRFFQNLSVLYLEKSGVSDLPDNNGWEKGDDDFPF